jgi:acyl-CoA synthetase (AMP-forming)/AMP-acid ligase II
MLHPDPRTMVELLEMRARLTPDTALRFLSDRGKAEAELTFASLRAQSIAIAEDLIARGARTGDRALLTFPPGLEFLVAWFGCLYANVIAVPMMPPRRIKARDSSENIIADCAPRFALTSHSFGSAIREDMVERFNKFSLEWVLLNGQTTRKTGLTLASRAHDQNDIAFLQYTSGSTASPKGVVVTHANLIANLEMIRKGFGNGPRSTFVSWVPLYHDMGLILNVLQAIYAGAACILLSPVSFLQRPLIWLRAISDFGAEVAGGPNFAFDHCVARLQPQQMEGVNLSCWKVAMNAAEPVRSASLQRFATAFAPYGFDPQAFYPCYGMAEATVFMSGGARGQGARITHISKSALRTLQVRDPIDEADRHPIVGCGRAAAGTLLAIVDPETKARLPFGDVGEVWGRGNHIAQGYWQRPEATSETFCASISGESSGQWLRTGDLGFINPDGELFIAGRIKDVIIIRGRNYYPQDIEHTVQSTDASLRAGFGAAFTIIESDDQERLMIIQEVERTQRHRTDFAEIAAQIREAVAEAHDLSVHHVILVAPGVVPKTTSGKIQRRLTRQLWQDSAFDVLHQL